MKPLSLKTGKWAFRGPVFKWPFLGPSEAPQGHFGGCKGVQVAHPRCGLRCSTMFNQCSTNLGQLGLPMAK